MRLLLINVYAGVHLVYDLQAGDNWKWRMLLLTKACALHFYPEVVTQTFLSVADLVCSKHVLNVYANVANASSQRLCCVIVHCEDDNIHRVCIPQVLERACRWYVHCIYIPLVPEHACRWEG